MNRSSGVGRKSVSEGVFLKNRHRVEQIAVKVGGVFIEQLQQAVFDVFQMLPHRLPGAHHIATLQTKIDAKQHLLRQWKVHTSIAFRIIIREIREGNEIIQRTINTQLLHQQGLKIVRALPRFLRDIS